MAAAGVAAVGSAACGGGDATVVVAPIIDLPERSSSASAFPEVETLELAVAHAGAPDDLAAATFRRGEALVLDGVPLGDDLVIHLTGRIGTSVVGYGRSCPFAVAAGASPPAPHVFFARTPRWATLDAPRAARHGAVGLTYHDGSGLWIGGRDAGGAPATALERFDPSTGAFSALPAVAPRAAAAVATLADGRVAIAGGDGATFVEVLEVDNPPARQVERVPDVRLARVGLTTTALADGRVIAIGGLAGGAPTGEVDELSVDGGTLSIRQRTTATGLPVQLATPRSGHTATRLGDDLGAPVLIAGGIDAGGAPVAVAELYKPLQSVVLPPGALAARMVVPRTRHATIRLPDNSAVIVGGIDAGGQPVRRVERFSLDSGFVDLGELPADAGGLEVAAAPLPTGGVLLAGGRMTDGGAPVATAYVVLLDSADGSVRFLETDPLAIPRAGAAATLLCDGTVMISGGTDAPSPAERYNPAPDRRR